jgi:hypothetical protein
MRSISEYCGRGLREEIFSPLVTVEASNLIRNSLYFVEPQGSLPCQQQPIIAPYLKTSPLMLIKFYVYRYNL